MSKKKKSEYYPSPYSKEQKDILQEVLNTSEILEKYNLKNKKLRWDLAPWEAFEKIVEVITYGAKEENYGVDNWKLVSSDVFDAAMIRHYVSYKKGERYDKRWNLTHLAHLGCNLVFLLWKELMVINIEQKGELEKALEPLIKEKGANDNG